MGGGLPVEPDLNDGAVQDQPDDVLAGEIAPLPRLPGRTGPPPSPADHVLADMAGEQAAQRPAYPAGVHAGQVGLGDQGFGTMAEPLVGWQRRALPFTLTRCIAQPAARH